MHNNTLIVVPAYNEELTIGSVVALSKKYGDVLVVDDGSGDRTHEVAISSGAYVIKHPRNMGKAHALKTAFRYAFEKGYEVVVCIDADGQHNPEEIPKLVEPILKDEADLVIGSRFLEDSKKNIPIYRRFGLKILNATAALTIDGVQITDFQSGFRAMNRRTLEEILKLNGDGYSMEGEALVHLAEKGIRIREVPITVRYDVPNKHKKNPLSHGLELLGGLLGLIGYKRPLLLFSTLSLIAFVIAGGLFLWAMTPYYEEGRVYLTQALGAGIFTIIGIQLFVAGLTLNVLAKMVRE
ncbi:glycosyltransferase family 2 protein [Thermococcus sp. MV11]|uniref:glycosyltransferase family 2 protein n=1 Tax=Thermococcus sp. MV11 TaxID=1638267 RepID=UPI0014306890|nr:glycosyltransferase family 2 protein [Thermococcus sp. MV11]NJE03836.1 glycosyltransferase family 2 protein [Thermococcus sp. MV11]